MVGKLELPNQNHPYLCKLQWLNKVSEVKCSLVSFSTGPKYQDAYDAIPIYAWHLVLWRLRQYNCCALYDGYANAYSFVKDVVKVNLIMLSDYQQMKSM